MRMVRSAQAQELLAALANRGARDTAAVEARVRAIVDEVRAKGDAALRRYAEQWDGLPAGAPFAVPQEQMRAALNSISAELRAALELAAENIRQYCRWQKPSEWMRDSVPGVQVGQLIRPLQSVGCYVPGGRYPLPSTLLMTVVPAQVAGVSSIAVVSPRPARETLAAAALLGVETVYCIGGAQAVAALAYGTESVEKVAKIVGPGNIYVTTAKKLVAWDCGIDMLAGPTEVVIVAASGEPRFIAADLVAQAEHDPDAAAILITSSHELARAVVERANELARENPTAKESLDRNGCALVTTSHEESLALANLIAPEHITVSRGDIPAIRNAGAVFVGEYSPEAMGDYISGPNHVLPTGAMARLRGGLSVLDYLKIISVQEASQAGLNALARPLTALAEAEGLKGHADSVRVRCTNA
jgi:histidinol dehydrogenase